MTPNLKLTQEKLLAENCEWQSFDPQLALDADYTFGLSDNPTATGMILQVTVGTLTGTPTYRPSLQGYDADGVPYAVWTAASAISSASTKYYWLGPGASTIGDYTEGVGAPVPRLWSVFIDYTGTPGAHYADVTVHVQLLR